jgi:cold-inducible RNA-binding protein
VELVHEQGGTAIPNKVFVGNLSFDVTREELIEAFSAVGPVVDAKLPTDRETGRPRGFAFVEFQDEASVQKSIQQMDGREIKGRAVRVNEADDRPRRPAGMGPGPGSGPGPGPRRPWSPTPPPRDLPPDEFDSGGRPFKAKGSRRNIRRRKRGFA